MNDKLNNTRSKFTGSLNRFQTMTITIQSHYDITSPQW